MTDDNDATAALAHQQYQEAMLTFRSVMAASVSTATALFAGTLTILGFGVEGDMSAPLIWLSAAPMTAMVILFVGWRWYNERAAEAVELAIGVDPLADDLKTRPGKWLIGAPIAATILIIALGAVARAGDNDDESSGRCVIEPPATGHCAIDDP